MTNNNQLIKLSVSKTSTFKGCKAKYKFSYIEKLPRKEWEFHTFGRFLHRILELFHLAYLEGAELSHEEVMGNAFNATMEEAEFKTKITQAVKDEAFSICETYLSIIKANPDVLKQIIGVESKFDFNLNDELILNGMIDRVQLDPDGVYHVLDYKTSKSTTYLKKDLLQLLTYAYVIYQQHPEIEKVRVSYIMLRMNCEFITKEFSLKEILTIKDVYEKFAKDIQSEEEYPANPTNLCPYCDYIELCPAGKAQVEQKYTTGATNWTDKQTYYSR